MLNGGLSLSAWAQAWACLSLCRENTTTGSVLTTTIVFETHATTEDNETGVATGWHPGRLSASGRQQARELGDRRRSDGIAVVFTSDLHRAIETADIAFGGSNIPILHDWRLRECDYGDLNGAPADEVHGDRAAYLHSTYPNGESWRQAVERAARFLPDLSPPWKGTRCLVIGHIATRWALEHYLKGRSLEDLATDEFVWQEGWEYALPD
jgi:broad specificity phosphatase PhoE